MTSICSSRAIAVLALLGALTAGLPSAGQTQHRAELPLSGEVFQLAERTAFLIPAPTDGVDKARPWVWYAPTLPIYPERSEK
jgi:hypothetical protein